MRKLATSITLLAFLSASVSSAKNAKNPEVEAAVAAAPEMACSGKNMWKGFCFGVAKYADGLVIEFAIRRKLDGSFGFDVRPRK